MINDTIAAISSGGKINQAISIIRLSGNDSISIIKKIFKGKIGQNMTITYGHIFDNFHNNEIVDEVLVMWYIGTKNYTGENTVEINCHGGVIITNRILELILANGARLALPGEFSRRSFLNGKMDLIKAEAINDLIHATTIKQSQYAIKKFDGQTSKMINDLKAELSYLIGQMEVNIDYPEYDDIEHVFNESLIIKLRYFQQKISKIVEQSENSRLIFEGIKIAILGRPNVGKSSLLNCLLNEDKAIVTSTPGTTRDIIEASYQLQGFLFKLIDTAGLRKATNKIETIGIDKALDQIKKCDVVIHMYDAKARSSVFDQEIENLATKYNKTSIQVINKKDLLDKNVIKKNNFLYVSAKNNDIDVLKDKLLSLFKDKELENQEYLNNARQLSLIKKALENINSAIKNLQDGYDSDLVIIDVRESWANLTDITGRADNELLLDEMFKNFCLGK